MEEENRIPETEEEIKTAAPIGGEIRIANEVVAVIAGLAATEVEGVESMDGNVTYAVISRLGVKNLSRGVKVGVEDGKVSIDLALNLLYGYPIPEVCTAVQDRVKSAIESMTGLTVMNVNVRICGIKMENGPAT